jgi:kinesin family protein 15
VLHLVEDKSNKVLALFSNFEEAQETMKEADLMLSALLMANEELKLEKDSCSEALELLLAEKTSLISELHQLEASSSCTAHRNNKLHQQMNECIKEMTKIATLVKGSFQQLQRATTVELFGLCSEIINFGQELKRWISDSRSYLVSVVSVLEEKATSAAQQVHLLNANAYTCVCQRVESRSCEVDDNNAAFLHETQAITETSREGFQNAPLLGSISHDISNVEKKALKHQQICIQNGNTQAGNSTDYTSLRRDFDRKSDIAEGLSFDLKLLQESTSYAKDMKDKAVEVSFALGKVQRELEIKTSETEDMLVKQKALEEELAQNGAVLIILRSELEQSQDSSYVLLKENSDLRVMLEEETGKTSEIRALLEDKAKVIEGLESEILLLNSSEEGQLRSDVEKLSNNVEILCDQNRKLKVEILKLNDKLEMAMALAEENEAAAVEARQVSVLLLVSFTFCSIYTNINLSCFCRLQR